LDVDVTALVGRQTGHIGIGDGVAAGAQLGQGKPNR
jgi:hypothetical protein